MVKNYWTELDCLELPADTLSKHGYLKVPADISFIDKELQHVRFRSWLNIKANA